jgi:16S rRNA (adenine1518-N6/adenine1519-N6)-dimethyltransferase
LKPVAARLPPVRKNLGQHFLTDRRILQRIVDAVDPAAVETTIEIGPGRGSLTELLVPVAKRLVLIEYDRALAALLTERYASMPHVTVVQADVLSVRLGELAGSAYRVVGNVPYYITTPILFQGLERPRAERSVYLVQREVAERMVAPAGSDAYGALSANVQSVANARIVFGVAAGAFQPPPRVESAVVCVEPRPDPVIPEALEVAYRRFVQDAFGQRRKQMRRVVRSVLSLSADEANSLLASCGIDPTARPETLDPAAFARIVQARAISRDSSGRS